MDIITLFDLQENFTAKISNIQLILKRKKRFESLGFVVGTNVEIISKTKTNITVKIKGTQVVISKNDAFHILIDDIQKIGKNEYCDKNCEREYCKKKYIKYKNKLSNCNFIEIDNKKIILIGNPNVGKSQIFSRITGLKVVSSNFPGTTVDIKKSTAKFFSEIGNKNYKINTNVYDIPGLYNLHNETTEKNAEKIAENEITNTENYDLIIYVLDAELLERSLNLALNILTLNKPVIFILNKYETAKSKGIFIDSNKLSQELKSPVVEVEAISGEGLPDLEKEIVKIFYQMENKELNFSTETIKTEMEFWDNATLIVKKVQHLEHRHPTFIQRLSTACVRPISGIPIALLVLIVSFVIVFVGGENLIKGLSVLFDDYIVNHFNSWFENCNIESIKTFLLGFTPDDTVKIIPGVLTDGLSISMIQVLSYVFIFYLIFEFLADIGYLPRLAILLDSVLHKIGIHGYGIIPIIMGFGCKVPAIFSLRVLEEKRERFIALILILLIFPCIGSFAGILSLSEAKNFGILPIIAVIFIILLTGIISALFLNKIMKGNSSEIFMEIPPLQLPKIKELFQKLLLHIKEYLIHTAPLIIIGVALVNVLMQTNILDLIAENSVIIFIIEKLMGLPAETAFNIVFGFLRKDASISLLVVNQLDVYQYIIACVFMSIYLPCLGTILVIKKEFGFKTMFKAVLMSFFISFLIAVFLNFFFKLIVFIN
ncbi:MAG: fused ferrous iron transport protein A/B [Bacteroidales bacterium]|jgi:ferrous iron transport protein B|nr:fused ferrous iron transport protein A/B [Bacteroidales bacterium]